MCLDLPQQTRPEVLAGAGRCISQSFITRAEKYKDRKRIKMSLLALRSSPVSRASCWEVVVRMRFSLTQLVSRLPLLAHTPPNCLPAPVCWDPCMPLLSHSCPDPEVQDGKTLPWFPVMSSSGWKVTLERPAHPCNSNFTSPQVSLEFPTVASVSSALLMSHGKWNKS